MHGLVAVLVPIIIVVAGALIIWYVAERFSPDPLITKIVQVVVFVVVLVVLIMKLLPLMGVG
jgi:hypothetical protein